MHAQLKNLPTDQGPAYIRRGVVTHIDENGGCLVLIRDQGSEQQIYAHPAMGPASPVHTGDTVVVAGERRAAGFIIGVMGGAMGSGAPQGEPRQVSAAAGAAARVVTAPGGEEHIEVAEPSGRVIFSYDTATGSSTISSQTGDLKLLAPNGNIDLVSGGQVRIRSRDPADAASRPQTLALDRHGLDLEVQRMRMSAARGEWVVGRSIFRGQQLDSHIHRARMVYGRLETVARQVWERLDEGCRQVKDLYQVKAGRLRTLVKETLHMKAGRTDLQAEEEVRIDAEKINLG